METTIPRQPSGQASKLTSLVHGLSLFSCLSSVADIKLGALTGSQNTLSRRPSLPLLLSLFSRVLVGGLEAFRGRDPALTAEPTGGWSPWQRTVHYRNGASLLLLQSHGQPTDALLQFLQVEVAPGRAEGGKDLSTSRVRNDTDPDRGTIC